MIVTIADIAVSCVEAVCVVRARLFTRCFAQSSISIEGGDEEEVVRDDDLIEELPVRLRFDMLIAGAKDGVVIVWQQTIYGI